MLTVIENFFVGKASAAFDWFNSLKISDDGGGRTAQETATSLIGNVVTCVSAIVFVTAFFYLIMNGIKYITAGGDAGKATEARTGIINAIIGIIIVILAYVIVRFAVQAGTNVAS